MTHQRFRRAIAGDVAAVVLLALFILAADRAVARVGDRLPGSALLWAVIGFALFVVAAFLAVAVCAWAPAKADRMIAAALDRRDRRDVVDAISGTGDVADAVQFDFPQRRPRLTVIAGGRQDGGEAA